MQQNGEQKSLILWYDVMRKCQAEFGLYSLLDEEVILGILVSHVFQLCSTHIDGAEYGIGVLRVRGEMSPLA